MKKKSFYLCSLFAAALMFTGCSDGEVTPGDGDGKLGELRIEFNFENVGNKARAIVPSTAVPPTSWSSINNLRIVLYDGSGVIKLAKTVNVTATGSNTQAANFTNILTGNYTLVAMANVQSEAGADNVYTYGTNGSTQTPWTDADMIGKNINNLYIKHRETTGFPSFANTGLTGKTPVVEPSEIFLGYATGVTITDGGNTPATVSLKREVSMLRVRMDVSHANVATTMDWTQDAGVFVYRLPQQMNIAEGTGSGVSSTSVTTHIQFTTGYNTGEPGGNYTGTMFPTDPDNTFTLWKDIIVFPNTPRTAGTGDAAALAAQKYFFVISGRAKAGHKDKEGTVVAAGTPMYWYAPIDGNFVSNFIREINLNVTTGGETVIPPDPKTYGNINITVNPPTEWDSNIRVENIPL